MEKFDQKQECWVHTQPKSQTTSPIRDEAYLLLEKLQVLGVRAILLLSRPGRKPNAWVSEVLAPRCELTETSSSCLQKIKDLYDIVIQGWTPQGTAGQLGEPSLVPVEPPTGPQIAQPDPQVAMALLDPSAASIGQPKTLTGPAAPSAILVASPGPPEALTGPPKSPIEQPAALIGPLTHHATPEQQFQNLGKGPNSLEGPPAASSLCVEKVFSADDQQLFVVKEEQQEWSPSLDQEDPQCPHIKEENLDLWTSQEQEGLHGEDITKFAVTHVAVKSEDNDEKPQSSQLHQRQTEEKSKEEPPTCSSTEQMKTEADGEGCGGAEQDRVLLSAFKCLSRSDGKTSRSSFSCSKCGKRFGQKHHLQTHMRCHTGEKPFSCSLCGKRFTQKGNLTQHLTVHTREKPCSCPVCGERFAQKGNLTQHMTVHRREKLCR